MTEQEKKVLEVFDWMGRTVASFSRGSWWEGSTSEPITIEGKPAVRVTLPDKTVFVITLEGWPTLHREEPSA